jgi:hypothetical protein
MALKAYITFFDLWRKAQLIFEDNPHYDSRVASLIIKSFIPRYSLLQHFMNVHSSLKKFSYFALTSNESSGNPTRPPIHDNMALMKASMDKKAM